MAPDTTKSSAAPKDPLKEKEASHNMEIVLATIPMPVKEDLKGKGLAFVPAEIAKSTKATGKANSPLKIN